MEEEVKKIIKNLLKQKNNILEGEKKIAEQDEIVKKLKDERDKFTDKESGFYKDATEKLQGARELYNSLTREREIRKHDLEEQIEHKKNEIIVNLKEKQKLLDENREIVVEEKLYELEHEKENLERLIEINDNREKYSYVNMNPEEKEEALIAYRNVLNNKKRLKDILSKIAIVQTLDGKEPKDKYLEISDMIGEINEKLTYDNIDTYREEIDKIEEKETDNQKVDNAEKENSEFKDFLLTPVEESIRKIKEEQIQSEEQKEQKLQDEETTNLNMEQSVKQDEKISTISQEKQSESLQEESEAKKSSENRRLINNHSIELTYIAKDRDYLIKNIDVKDAKGRPSERKINEVLDIAKGDEDYTQKVYNKNAKIKNINNIDVTLLNALKQNDTKYSLNKAQIYFNVMTNPEKYGSPKEIKKYMKKNNLKIVYDLRGIYDEQENENMTMSTEERRKMLQLANNAKKMGIAKVKKGFKVYMLEAVDGIKLNKTKMLPLAKKDEKRKIKNEPKKQTENKKFTGKITDYMKEMKVEIKRDLKTMSRKLNDFADRMKVDEETERRLNEVCKENIGKEENNIEEQEMEDIR